jgi:GTPase
MGGHERCRKTTLWGMTCLVPDYAIACVCAAGGPGSMTREHLAVAVALEGE